MTTVEFLLGIHNDTDQCCCRTRLHCEDFQGQLLDTEFSEGRALCTEYKFGTVASAVQFRRVWL